MNPTKAERNKNIERWISLIILSAVLGIETARMWVFLPDWIREFLDLLEMIYLRPAPGRQYRAIVVPPS